MIKLRRAVVVTASVLLSISCIDGAGPNDGPLAFDVASVDLGTDRSIATSLTNNGQIAYGPITLRATAVIDDNRNPATGATVQITPDQIATLNPGASQNLTVTISAPTNLPDGVYQFEVVVSVPAEGDVGSLQVQFTVGNAAANAQVATLIIQSAPSTARQGDVIDLIAEPRDAQGVAVSGAVITWNVSPSAAGYVDPTGAFVSYQSGQVTVSASAGNGNASVVLDITPRNLSRSFTVVGQGNITTRYTSDLWAFANTVFTGTWSIRTVGNIARAGNTMYVWEIAPDGTPVLQDSVRVDARVVNDVKIRSDGQLGVMTHEGSNDGQNGVTFLDLADPNHPTEITRFTNALTSGVHNVWLEGDYAYVVVDGTGPASGLRILDVSDPAAPFEAATFYGGSSFLHDVYVRDGLAFLSHWNAGLIILDVGHGIEGGSPTNPVEVSRILTAGGQTHNAWYWPQSGYVFTGEEDFSTPGMMHVIDVSDLRLPREVATMAVPGTTPHNFWLDEPSGTLYLSWYTNGVRALDVTGRLLGTLETQGREYAGLQYAGTGPGCSGPTNTHTCNWAPQFHQGRLYLSDMNTGLWVLQPSP